MSWLRGRLLAVNVAERRTRMGRKTTAAIGALRLSGMTAPMALDGTLSANAFRAYVRQVCVPTRMPGDIVVMDNVSAHKTQGMREAIEATGCQLVSLAAYSRDFHSIENAFAKRKALLRAKAKRSMHAL